MGYTAACPRCHGDWIEFIQLETWRVTYREVVRDVLADADPEHLTARQVDEVDQHQVGPDVTTEVWCGEWEACGWVWTAKPDSPHRWQDAVEWKEDPK